jgi:hypothetical protein
MLRRVASTHQTKFSTVPTALDSVKTVTPGLRPGLIYAARVAGCCDWPSGGPRQERGTRDSKLLLVRFRVVRGRGFRLGLGHGRGLACGRAENFFHVDVGGVGRGSFFG